MPEIIYTRGLPASGKSTWAIEKSHDSRFKRVNNDDLRLMLDGIKFDEANEDFVREARRTLCRRVLEAGLNLIVDNCNLSPKAMQEIEHLGREHGITPVCQDFTDVPIDVCYERDAARGSKAVGRKVIHRMHEQFLAPRTLSMGSVFTPVTQGLGLPLAVIFDIDGTLADHDGIRGHYDYSRVSLDRPHRDIFDLAKMFRDLGYTILYVSGRDGTVECWDSTEVWLKRHGGVNGDSLWMRAAGDRRPDDIVKREILERDLLPTWNIKYVFDDRDRVVSMWRQSGLRCFQVADGAF